MYGTVTSGFRRTGSKISKSVGMRGSEQALTFRLQMQRRQIEGHASKIVLRNPGAAAGIDRLCKPGAAPLVVVFTPRQESQFVHLLLTHSQSATFRTIYAVTAESATQWRLHMRGQRRIGDSGRWHAARTRRLKSEARACRHAELHATIR